MIHIDPTRIVLDERRRDRRPGWAERQLHKKGPEWRHFVLFLGIFLVGIAALMFGSALLAEHIEKVKLEHALEEIEIEGASLLRRAGVPEAVTAQTVALHWFPDSELVGLSKEQQGLVREVYRDVDARKESEAWSGMWSQFEWFMIRYFASVPAVLGVMFILVVKFLDHLDS